MAVDLGTTALLHYDFGGNTGNVFDIEDLRLPAEGRVVNYLDNGTNRVPVFASYNELIMQFTVLSHDDNIEDAVGQYEAGGTVTSPGPSATRTGDGIPHIFIITRARLPNGQEKQSRYDMEGVIEFDQPEWSIADRIYRVTVRMTATSFYARRSVTGAIGQAQLAENTEANAERYYNLTARKVFDRGFEIPRL